MKKIKDIDTNGVNDLVFKGRKILNLIYIFMIVALIIGGITIADRLNLFDTIFSILGLLSPLLIGFIIAWLFNPLVNRITNKGVPRIGGSLIVYLCIILFLVLFVSLIIPIFTDQVNEFINLIPSLVNTLTNFLDGIFESIGSNGVDVDNIRDTLNTNIEKIGTDLAVSLPGNALGAASSIFSSLWSGILSFVIGFYILVDFEMIQSKLYNLIPNKHRAEVITLTSNIGDEVRKCINGILLIATMVFICDTVGFAIVGLEAALLIGLVCGITDLIPYIGPFIGGGIAVLVGFTQGPVIGVGVLIIALIVQILENYVMQPVVMGKAISIHPTIIMTALLVFGAFFGVPGMILTTPILAIIKVVIKFLDTKYNILPKSGNKVIANC